MQPPGVGVEWLKDKVKSNAKSSYRVLHSPHQACIGDLAVPLLTKCVISSEEYPLIVCSVFYLIKKPWLQLTVETGDSRAGAMKECTVTVLVQDRISGTRPHVGVLSRELTHK